MLHLNDEILKEFYKSPSLLKMPGLIMQLLYPECYVSTTIDDFVSNVDDIKLTRKILPPGILYNNMAIISFNDVRYRRTGKRWCEIEDMNYTLKAKILMEDKDIDELSDGTVLEEAYMLFTPYNKSSLLWFANYSVFQTPAAERQKYMIPAYAGLEI